MKVQEVKKDCTAVVGVSLEFNSSEMSAISRLVWNLEADVEKGIANATVVAKASEKAFENASEVNIVVNLEKIQKVLYLLNQMCRREDSTLFWMADTNAATRIQEINVKAGLIDLNEPEVPEP